MIYFFFSVNIMKNHYVQQDYKHFVQAEGARSDSNTKT